MYDILDKNDDNRQFAQYISLENVSRSYILDKEAEMACVAQYTRQAHGSHIDRDANCLRAKEAWLDAISVGPARKDQPGDFGGARDRLNPGARLQ
jgi:hypothetical protein